MIKNLSAHEAMQRLMDGNRKYISSATNPGDISPEIRRETCANGQKPYAIILACSDSREIPEAIFCAGIGELFVIRVAGNVIDDHQLGSIEYAADHLGAVDAAINHDPDGHIKFITDEISLAIGGERDELKACRLNVERSVRLIKENPDVMRLEDDGLEVVGAVYHIEDGGVEFL